MDQPEPTTLADQLYAMQRIIALAEEYRLDLADIAWLNSRMRRDFYARGSGLVLLPVPSQRQQLEEPK